MAGQPSPEPRSRPVSPHLQVYRPQLTTIMSILHRLTGIFLALGLLYLACWLWAVANGADSFQRLQSFNAGFIGRLLLFLWSGAFFYHLLNGIRHLFWDAGFGFELKTVYRSGIAVFIAAAILTLAAWVFAYQRMGAF
jgi:succinate dehydrogenase / fumarate reductase, cytochrome b subunit